MPFVFHEIGTRSYFVEEVSHEEIRIRKYLRWILIFEDAGGYWP